MSQESSPSLTYRIFLPKNTPNTDCSLFGHRLERPSTNLVDYYVIETSSDSSSHHHQLHSIGRLSTAPHQGKSPSLKLPSKRLHLHLTEPPSPNTSIVVLYYDQNKFLQSQMDAFSTTSIDSHFSLTLAQHLATFKSHNRPESSVKSSISMLGSVFTPLGLLLSKLCVVILSPLFSNTVTYRHCVSWKKCFVNSTHLRNGFVLLDVLLGLAVLVLLTHIRECGKHFMDLTEIIVHKLRALLTMLEGSPVGLKLNEQLNLFLLRCFMYHVDLWFNFIIIIEPAIRLLFMPISFVGVAGFSFQCAIICDLFTLLTLHAHCFYIYAAMLYKLELKGLQSLWRIVLGRRKNVLKNRIESQEYTKRQLFLATLFFTVLLFLLPTIIIYYLVFASLRFAIYCLTYIMKSLQQKILEFPFLKFLRWALGAYVDPTNCSIDVLQSEGRVMEVDIRLNNSFPWKKSKFERKIDLELQKLLSLNAFALQLVRGDIMAF